MTYAALTNWRYDKNIYHQIQSGPQRTSNDLDLTDTYVLTSSGYVYASGEQQTYVALTEPGANFGVVTPGPPQAFPADLGIETTSYPETKTLEVTVVSDGGNKFAIDGVSQKSLTLIQGSTYIFDLSDTSTSSHPFRLSETDYGIWASGVEFTNGVTTSGVQGNPGAYLQIVVPEGQQGAVYPYCTVHSGMGGSAVYSFNAPPYNLPIYQSTEWRAVPPTVSGYWTNYDNYEQHASGVLTVYNGYRRQAMISTANATVQTAFGPIPGVKSIGAYTYWNGAHPSSQRYNPFNTPFGQDAFDGGSTGGAGTYPRGGYPMLYNTVVSGQSRADWEYAPPVYCQTFASAERSNVPGTMNDVIRGMYRGRASTYVPNYGAAYGVLGEGVRGMIRTFSSSVNSSNQKGI
jgi:hypothetical protein